MSPYGFFFPNFVEHNRFHLTGPVGKGQRNSFVFDDQFNSAVLVDVEGAEVQDMVPRGDPRTHTPEGLAALLNSQFGDLAIQDFSVGRRMQPSAYWDLLADMYSVDCLPAQFQARLRQDVLIAMEPMRESDGTISFEMGLRLFAATRL